MPDLHLDLDSLSTDDLRNLQAQLAYRLDKTSSVDHTSEQAEAWDIIHEALGIERARQPLKQAMSNMGVKNFSLRVEQLNTFVAASCAENLRRPQRRAVTRMVLECLAEHLEEMGLPQTPSMLLKNVGLLRTAVDNCYPGYIACGMLHRIATMKVPA